MILHQRPAWGEEEGERGRSTAGADQRVTTKGARAPFTREAPARYPFVEMCRAGSTSSSPSSAAAYSSSFFTFWARRLALTFLV